MKPSGLRSQWGDNPYKASDFPMYVAKRDRASDRIAVE